MSNESKKLLRLNEAAKKLTVPVLWLKKEADANQIPHLNAGGVLLFNLDAVQSVLVQRAANLNKKEPVYAGS